MMDSWTTGTSDLEVSQDPCNTTFVHFRTLMSTTQQYFGLGGIELIGTDTFKYQDKIAFRYCFQTWKVFNKEQNLIETDRFHVWSEAVDTAYKIAVAHVYRGHNEPYQPEVDASENGGRYEVALDEQHREVIVDTEEDWNTLMYGNRDDFYHG
jgi:hypothetical protein